MTEQATTIDELAFTRPYGEQEKQILTAEAVEFLTELVTHFTPQRNKLLAARRAFSTPCTVGYLTTARLLPSGFLSLAPSQSAAFVPFHAHWRKTFTPITAGNLC